MAIWVLEILLAVALITRRTGLLVNVFRVLNTYTSWESVCEEPSKVNSLIRMVLSLIREMIPELPVTVMVQEIVTEVPATTFWKDGS